MLLSVIYTNSILIVKRVNCYKSFIMFITDTYCRMYLFREDGMERQTTKIKRNNHNPVWDEKHTFKVATSSSHPLQMLSLAITLISNSIISKDEVIGHVIFSLDSSQDSAVSHWRQVNDCPHLSITNWHTLTEPEEL